MKKVLIATAAIAFASLAVVPTPSRAWGIDFQDTYLSMRGVPSNKDPGFSQNIPEIAGNISYANGWTYGSNFASIDFENFSRGDRANSVNGKGTNSSAELYASFRTTLSGNKISGTKMFGIGPLRDVGLELGGDWATQDDQFATNKKTIVIGPQFSIDLPRGFWTITLAMQKEFSNNAFINTGTNYRPTGLLETAWAFPFAVGPVPISFTGFMNVIGAKGKGATADTYHHTEILLRPKLLVDVGELLGYAPNKIQAGPGIEYWHDKFGNAASNNGAHLPGTEEFSLFGEIGYHF